MLNLDKIIRGNQFKYKMHFAVIKLLISLLKSERNFNFVELYTQIIIVLR